MQRETPAGSRLHYQSAVTGGAILLLLLLQQGFAFLRNLIGSGFSPLGAAVFSLFSYLLLMGLPLLTLLFLSELPRRTLLPLGRAPKGSLWLLPLSLAGLILLNALSTLLLRALGPRFTPFTEPTDFSPGGLSLFLELFSCTLLPALLEELLFRGAVLRGLLHAGEGKALFVSALLFALCHGSPAQWLPAFGAGLWFGLLSLRTGSLHPSVLAHFSYNLFAALSAIVPTPLFGVLLPACFFTLALPALFFIRRNGLLSRSQPAHAAKGPAFTPPLILAMLLAAVSAVLTLLH